MKKLLSLFAVLLFCSPLVFSQSPKEGVWKGAIIYESVEVPFNFEYANSEESDPTLIFINGEDRASLKAEVRNDSLIIPMFGFDITLKMAMGEERMTGELIKHYRNQSYAFEAVYGLPRYEITEETNPVEVGSRWAMKVNAGQSSEYPAVGLFEQNGNRVTGTIMTKVSDYRFFEGKVEGNALVMSTFDGVHSFVLKGVYDETLDSWSGELILDNGYAQKWGAEKDESAELPNPFEMVDLSEKDIKPDFDKLSALSNQKIDPETYKGKVLVIQLMGTWCANSQDQTRYLTNWYAKNKDRNVEILAVNYEANYSPEYGLSRIETYKERLGIEYDMILGGRISKSEAAHPFPFMDQIEAFPTLVIIDKEGYARHVHSYFTGPATGEYYEDFDRRFNAIIDELVAE
ncbi:MAG: hypothetical protein CL670_11715 [Balneola sp.]|jgi:thiol-disulfide isomerase/thioredoxin|nr:hypothetical protein [Balneola sp.]MBE79814.1 hypothetical protein [Balneola sp.]|tara:strand:- start:42283 stop:43491 length:1209 start_codon:yes stop_codon:yes gene_type:complete